MPLSVATGNSARTVAPPDEPIMKSTGAGVELLIWRWILTRSALVLCVLKRLAATVLGWPPRIACAAARRGRVELARPGAEAEASPAASLQPPLVTVLLLGSRAPSVGARR